MKGSGCYNCPVKGCTATYRGSRCAHVRELAGVGFDPKTNADHIRVLSDEQLRDFLYSYKFYEMCDEGCEKCNYNGDCEKRLLDWLRKPVEGKDEKAN